MERHYTSRRVLLALVATLLVASCAKVPPEVVRLSSTLGEDIVATQTSYQLLITRHFTSLREQVNAFVDTRWRPVFLQKFIQDGNLVGRAKDPNPVEVLTGVNNWAIVAVETIDARRKELLEPIDTDEKALRVAVDEAFNRMIRANTAVTAHLNSIRKVTEFQDQILQAAGVRELRDTINDALIASSDKTQKAIDAVAKADKVVTTLTEKRQ
jgi:hypothetical protein